MGDYQSDKCFYQSIQTNVYHSLIIKSEWLIFLEVTEGPFERIKTLYASWSPDESDTKSVKIFMDYLKTSFP